MRTGCRRTISRKTRIRSSPIAALRPTSACTCCRLWRHVTSAGSDSATWSIGWTQPLPACARWRELEGATRNLLDVVQAFTDERADATDSEILAWAEALHADVGSHSKEA